MTVAWLSGFKPLAGRAVVAAAAAGLLSAAAFLSRPLHLVVTYPAGGASDGVARLIAQVATTSLGVQVLVENRPGGSGTVGLNWLARAAPDGQTLGIGTVSTLAIAPHVHATSYQARQSFEPVGLIGVAPLYAVVRGGLSAGSLAELAALARQRTQGLSYASVGEGSLPHVAARRFSRAAGIKMLHVPYAGSAQARIDMIAGRVDVMFDQLATFGQDDFRSGRLKALAVFAPTRTAHGLPVPTAAEAGYPGLEMQFWMGLLAPAGTPPDITARLNKVLAHALSDDGVRRGLVAFGIEPRPGSEADFAHLIETEDQGWRQVLHDEQKQKP